MQRITDFRIDTVEIDMAAFHRLPQAKQDLIHAYAEFKKPIKPGFYRFEPLHD